MLNNEFPTVEAHIIDCRYPYEYNGGHIKVKMLYMKPVFSTMNLDGSCSFSFLAIRLPPSMLRNIVTLLSFCEDVACSRGVVLLQFLGQSTTSITKEIDLKGHIRSPYDPVSFCSLKHILYRQRLFLFSRSLATQVQRHKVPAIYARENME